MTGFAGCVYPSPRGWRVRILSGPTAASPMGTASAAGLRVSGAAPRAKQGWRYRLTASAPSRPSLAGQGDAGVDVSEMLIATLPDVLPLDQAEIATASSHPPPRLGMTSSPTGGSPERPLAGIDVATVHRLAPSAVAVIALAEACMCVVAEDMPWTTTLPSWRSLTRWAEARTLASSDDGARRTPATFEKALATRKFTLATREF